MIRQTDPSVPVRSQLIGGAAVAVLIEQAATAELIVLGDRGLGGFAGLLLGSVSQQVLHHAHCPILVVPHPRRRA